MTLVQSSGFPFEASVASRMRALDPVLSVRELSVHFETEEGVARAVQRVSFDVARGETLCIVGESGSGKSVSALAIMRLVQSPGVIEAESILFRDKNEAPLDLTLLTEAEMQKVRGNGIGIIFQEPMTSLNPVFPIGEQIAESIRLHQGLSRRAARERAVELLDLVGVAEAKRRAGEYPHRLSGGLRQRAMIAMALACEPTILIADEPTTALDVTIQAQILDLLRRLQTELGMGILFITHDLGVVAEIADRVAVMYAGQIVEQAATRTLFRTPRHPYTRALLACMPDLDASVDRPLLTIPGNIPSPLEPMPGCRFAPRCSNVVAACHAGPPPLVELSDEIATRCIRWRELE